MYFGPIFDLFYPRPPKPTFDLFLTYFNVFGVWGPLGRLLLHNSCVFFKFREGEKTHTHTKKFHTKNFRGGPWRELGRRSRRGQILCVGVIFPHNLGQQNIECAQRISVGGVWKVGGGV